VKTRTKAAGLLLLLMGTACLALMAAHTTEPKYKSQPLSYWIELNRRLDRFGMVPVPDGRVPWYRDLIEQQQRDLNEARVAITTIGTNGLPCLTRWMRYQPPLWGTRFIPWGPRRLRNKLDHRIRFNNDRADRAEAAMQALVVLGTNAVPAIPELAALAMKTNILDRDIAGRATSTLFYFGPQAYPALMNVWSNTGAGQKNPFLYWRILNLLTNTPAQ
jgi:hypothetical protein